MATAARPRTCGDCKGKGWEIKTRTFNGKFPDLKGRRAVVKCERCGHFSTDEDAAVAAKKAGIKCSPLFPCVLDPEEPLS